MLTYIVPERHDGSLAISVDNLAPRPYAYVMVKNKGAKVKVAADIVSGVFNLIAGAAIAAVLIKLIGA